MLHQAQAVRPPEARVGAEVTVRNLTRLYGDQPVLDNISFSVRDGERVGVVGRSGIGKSTLLAVIAGLDEPSSGSVAIGSETTAEARLARCVLMPQADCLFPWRTAVGNAALALENQGVPASQAQAEASRLFTRLGLDGMQRLRPYELSGGMRQRVAFARTVLARKPVLLLDEPFGALDTITRYELQDWLHGYLSDESATVLLVTHDIEEALVLCDRVLAFTTSGEIVEVAGFGAEHARRPELVTDPAFLTQRAHILEQLS